MKKYVFACAVFVVLASCSNGTSSTSDGTKTNSSATDSTQTPNGISNGDIISTDTAATRLDTSNHK